MNRRFLITIYNGSDVLVEKAVIEGQDGNDALVRYLRDSAPIIYDGDTITIEEIEEE